MARHTTWPQKVRRGHVRQASSVATTDVHQHVNSCAVCQSTPYSSKADVWSLGCILYELCMLRCGAESLVPLTVRSNPMNIVARGHGCRHAFNADSLFALLFQIMNGKYEPLPASRYSADMVGLLSVLLQHDPELRPSCKALIRHPYVQKHIEYTMHKVGRCT